MRREFIFGLALATVSVLAICSGSALGQGGNNPPRFHSAEVTFATDVTIPFNSVANGIVTLYATIGTTGKVEDVEVVHDLPSVTEQAIATVKSWKYSPGTWNGKPVSSRLAISVVFCPSPMLTSQIPLPQDSVGTKNIPVKVDPPSQLPGVTAAEYPAVVAGSAATVVLQPVIAADGSMDYAKVIKDVPYLTAVSLRTLTEKWKFSSATAGTEAVRSVMVVAFAFRPAPANSSY